MVIAADQTSIADPASAGTRASIVASGGELRRATVLALEVLQQPDPAAAAVAAARVALAIVAREQDRLDDARHELDIAIRTATRADCAGIVAVARLEQALVASSSGAHLEAIGIVVDVDRQVVPDRSDRRLRILVDAVDALVHLADGDVDRADVLIERLPAGTIRSLLTARIDLARGRDEAVLTVVHGVLSDDEPDLRRRIEALLLASRAEDELGDHGAARRRRAAAALLTTPEGHVRPYRDLGLEPPGVDETGDDHIGVDLVPPWVVLSGREQEVLRLLQRRLDNQEIGAAMYISVNTVKTHLQSIYRKLGVASRREAVERAAAMGLL